MRIDRLGIALRTRSGWEAVDLGIALARHHARAWLAPWWLCAGLLCALALALGHALGMPWLAPLAVWWLKPALDRLPLFVLSRAVFGHEPTRAEVYRAALAWGWGPTLPRLLWLRFDPFRALSMPSDLLEGLPRVERGQRRALLRREGGAHAAGLWLLLPWFEGALCLALWALVGLMIPLEWWEARGGDWFRALGAEEAPWLELIVNAVWCVGVLAIEPFFAAAGFGLYLSRRMHLEAWDLELGFKRMAARAVAAGRGVATALLLLCAVGLAVPEGVEAKTKTVAAVDAPAPPTPLPAGFIEADAAVRLESALRTARDDASLGGVETVERWRMKDLLGDSLDDAEREPLLDWRDRLGRAIGAVVGRAAEALLWVLALGLLAYVLWRYRDWLPWRREGAAAAPVPPPLTHRGPTPEDVAAAPELLLRARAAWARGDGRDAFACLYRAGLREVSVRRPRPLPPGTTEGELLRAARSLAHAPAGEHVRRLVLAWRAVAYAGARPDAHAFEALIAAWPQAFGEARP
jgi:hypothetical protein